MRYSQVISYQQSTTVYEEFYMFIYGCIQNFHYDSITLTYMLIYFLDRERSGFITL